MHDLTTGGHAHAHPHARAQETVTTADGHVVTAGTVVEAGELWAGDKPGLTLWIDASQGASGDMLLGALLDAGADAASVARVLELVAPGKLHLQWRRVARGPFSAMKVDVIADEQDPPARHLSDVLALIDAPGVPEPTKELASRAFTLLAEAEAKVHGMGAEDVHFHEVGALDSIGDIVGVCEAVRTLGVTRGISSVVALGTGTVETQHGLLTVPPPAVVELSLGFEVEAGGPPEAGELCTPTGMALIRTLCDAVGPLPRMVTRAVGVGAGTRVRQDRAGVLRVLVGEATATDPGTASPPGHELARLHEMSANVDDLDPRVWPDVLDRLLEAGAVDAWLVPVTMKKGRPAHVVTALAPEPTLAAVGEAMTTHTSTIGVRITAPMHRRVLERQWVPVHVSEHRVRIKVSGAGPGRPIKQATPEFVDIEELARRLGVPQRVALQQAQFAAQEAGLLPGRPWPGDQGRGADGS